MTSSNTGHVPSGAQREPSNTDRVRSLYTAFAQGDVPAVLQHFAPDIHWFEAEGFPHGGEYVGPDAVLQNVIVPLGTEWSSFAITPEQFVCEGDVVISLGQYAGTWRTTGRGFRAPYAHVWTLRDGKISSFRQFTDTAVVRGAID